MYKNLKISTVECLENENYHVYRKLRAISCHQEGWLSVHTSLSINSSQHDSNDIESMIVALKLNRIPKLFLTTFTVDIIAVILLLSYLLLTKRN